MTTVPCVEMVHYRVSAGFERATVDAEFARAVFDAHPEQLRSGKRDGAFILWSLDEHGCLCAPILCKPDAS